VGAENGFAKALLRSKWALRARSRALVAAPAVFRSSKGIDRPCGAFPVVAAQKRPLLYGGCEFSV